MAPIGNGSPISRVDTIAGKFSDKKYIYDEIINGVTIGLIAQYGINNNGLALAGLWNAMDKSNGAQVSIMLNEALYSNGIQLAITNTALLMNGLQIGIYNYSQSMKGLQIGLFNKSEKTRGIQLGIWNSNEKRKLPFLNWNFKS